MKSVVQSVSEELNKDKIKDKFDELKESVENIDSKKSEEIYDKTKENFSRLQKVLRENTPELSTFESAKDNVLSFGSKVLE